MDKLERLQIEVDALKSVFDSFNEELEDGGVTESSFYNFFEGWLSNMKNDLPEG